MKVRKSFHWKHFCADDKYFFKTCDPKNDFNTQITISRYHSAAMFHSLAPVLTCCSSEQERFLYPALMNCYGCNVWASLKWSGKKSVEAQHLVQKTGWCSIRSLILATKRVFIHFCSTAMVRRWYTFVQFCSRSTKLIAYDKYTVLVVMSFVKIEYFIHVASQSLCSYCQLKNAVLSYQI